MFNRYRMVRLLIHNMNVNSWSVCCCTCQASHQPTDAPPHPCTTRSRNLEVEWNTLLPSNPFFRSVSKYVVCAYSQPSQIISANIQSLYFSVSNIWYSPDKDVLSRTYSMSDIAYPRRRSPNRQQFPGRAVFNGDTYALRHVCESGTVHSADPNASWCESRATNLGS